MCMCECVGEGAHQIRSSRLVALAYGGTGEWLYMPVCVSVYIPVCVSGYICLYVWVVIYVCECVCVYRWMGVLSRSDPPSWYHYDIGWCRHVYVSLYISVHVHLYMSVYVRLYMSVYVCLWVCASMCVHQFNLSTVPYQIHTNNDLPSCNMPFYDMHSITPRIR